MKILKLSRMIELIQKDKLLHYIVAYLIFDICFSVGERYDINTYLNSLIAFGVSTIAIFLKEVLDEIDYNGWSWGDILAGYLGVLTKIILILITIL